jgi:hypothetical protein
MSPVRAMSPVSALTALGVEASRYADPMQRTDHPGHRGWRGRRHRAQDRRVG